MNCSLISLLRYFMHYFFIFVSADNRVPVFIPSRCPENELFFPGDQIDDWICDCRPGYLYHPKSDKCWPAYGRGPCAAEKYLMLLPNTVVPVCIDNPCKTDFMVLWQGRCERLGSSAPCGTDKYPAESLWVNSTTLNIECLPVTESVLIYTMAIQPIQVNDICSPGCKRSIQKKCTPKKF